MAKLNIPRKLDPVFTHEGGKASHINAEQMLKRTVLSCMLWEKTFYEDGQTIADRIISLVPLVSPEKVAALAIEARGKFKLRHAPLLLVRAMAAHPSHKNLVADTLFNIIQRPDELSEFLALYWATNKRKTISAQAKKGLAKAFTKFNAFQLAKWNRDGLVKLRDVLFLSHAKPKDTEQAELWKKLIANELPTPDTWEVELSASKDKTASWTRLVNEDKLGALALLRNLRNIREANVDRSIVKAAIRHMKTERVLPFRFIAAARYAPELEVELEYAMLKSIAYKDRLPGKTILLIDVSGSMDDLISARSEMTRMDAACGLAVLAREICKEVDIYSFSHSTIRIPPRCGFALRDAIINSQDHGGTYTQRAIETVISSNAKFDRMIIFTDEQSHDNIADIPQKGYIINVAANKYGIGYDSWTHINGFSEAVLDYIIEIEKCQNLT